MQQYQICLIFNMCQLRLSPSWRTNTRRTAASTPESLAVPDLTTQDFDFVGTPLLVLMFALGERDGAGTVFRDTLQTISRTPPYYSAVYYTCARSLTQTHWRDCEAAGRHDVHCWCVRVRRMLGRADRACALSSYPHCCGIERQAAGGTASSLIMPALFSNPPS